MEFEAEEEENPIPKLPLLAWKHQIASSPERPNALNSPLHSSASVPFSWEEEPGKAKQSNTSSSSLSDHVSSENHAKTLELPPRLQLERDSKKMTKLPSPTTVLDGPYSMGRSRRFDSPSFRVMVSAVGGDCYGSFRSEINGPEDGEDEDERRGQSKALVFGRKGGVQGRGLGFVGLWKTGAGKGKREVGKGSYVFPSSVDRESEFSKEGEEDGDLKITRIARVGSLSNLSASKSHFWANVYQGLKQVVPWKKSKKIRREFL